MKKNLPNVFANPITKTINNNKEVCYTPAHEDRGLKTENVPQKINEIFASPNHVYKSTVKIRTNNEEITTTIVGRTNTHLLTLNGEKISLNSIEYIEKI